MRPLDKTLESLKKECLCGLGDRIAKLEQWLSRLEQNPSDAHALKELKLHFHSLAGTASLFGLAQISDPGWRAERVCDALLDGKTPATDSDINQWKATLDALRAELPKASEDRG